MKAWIIDDDKVTRAVIKKILEDDGYETREFSSAQGVVESLSENPDIILLDVRMPDKRGTDLCRDIRGVSDVPIIFLSSADDPVDKVVGLEVGGDDYIPKPFDERELSARIRAVRRRHERVLENAESASGGKPASSGKLSVGILSMDPVGFRTVIDGQEIQLTKIEFEILRTLMSEPERVFSRDSLMDSAYEGVKVSKKTIDSHVHRVRSNFTRFNIDPIRTVRGFGYAIDTTALKA